MTRAQTERVIAASGRLLPLEWAADNPRRNRETFARYAARYGQYLIAGGHGE